MSLKDLLDGGNLIKEATSRNEVQELLRVAARSLSDAVVPGLSADGKFALAYDAALQLSTIPLRCAGYRTRGEGHHWAIFHVLPDMMGQDFADLADYFQSCRSKRSVAIYRKSSVVTQTEAAELVREAEGFDKQVRHWIKQSHPQYA